MAAVPANAQHSLLQNGDTRANDASAQADPFYQSTPRTNPPGLMTLIAAMQQAVPQPPPARQSRQPAPRMRVPACTHMTTSRVYGANVCHQCGKLPSIGWLYACRQDAMPQTHDLSVSDSLDSLPTVPDSSSYFEAQAQVAASIGMSASIIKQIIAGHYAFDQIEILLAQRRHVIETIRRTKNPSTASVPPTPKSVTRHGETTAPDDVIASVETTAAPAAQNLNIAALPMSQAGTPHNTPSDSQTALPNTSGPGMNEESSARKALIPKEACRYQVCHTCRPFFQDRLAMSFKPALNNEVPPLAQRDIITLPVHDAAVVSNLGLRRRLPHPPLRRSEESMDVTKHERDGNGYESFGTSSDWTPTTTTDSEAESDLSERLDFSPCPGPGRCHVWIEGRGCAYGEDINNSKRAIGHGPDGEERRLALGLGISDPHDGCDHDVEVPGGHLHLTPSKGSSVSLPNFSTSPLTVSSFSSKDSYSPPDRSSPRSNKSSSSSSGSEVEVEGGVALTEEAVETGTPDIAVKNGG